MYFKQLCRHMLAALTIFIAALAAFSQQASPNFNRPRTYDVQNYIIRVSFDRSKKTVFGDTTVELKPLAGAFTTAELDAVGMNFDSVTLGDGRGLKYRTAGGKIIVTLDKPYSPNETVSIRFKYSTTPKKGVYFVDELSMPGQDVQPPQIWSQGESEEARYWFPSFDFPSDKATSEEFITADAGETVIANGELIEQTPNENGTVTWHYKMPIPYSTYLTSFVVGKYVKVADSYGDLPLGFYVYPGKESIARTAFGRTKDMIQAFEELTGVKFPYNKYDQTIVRGFQFGGMENITATTLADTEVFFAATDFGQATVQDLVSHELAHSWFGDMVTCKNWSELWLNEGFATFMEAAAREKLYGRDSYIRKVASDADQAMADDEVTRRRHALVNMLAKPDDSLFDTTTYQKGGAVIHTLRETVGDDAFWKAINIYLNRHKFANVDSSDLQQAMEEASGKDLKWFFAQWVYSAGVPKLTVRQVYSPRTKTLKLTVTQTQKLDKIVPAAFVLPMDLEIKTAKGVRNEDLNITKRAQVFSIKVDGKPLAIKLDKDFKIPLKAVKIEPLTVGR
jgi:aminopeptidase N